MNSLATIHPQATIATRNEVSTQALIFEPQAMQAMLQMAEMMSQAAVTVPKHLVGKPADCLSIIMQAAQWGMNPFAVAQKTHIVNGQLGYEAQLVNAVVQNSGAIQGRFHYDYRGEGANIECRVGAVLAGEREITWGEWLSAASVVTKNSPLWKTNPRQQLGYLQIKNWARLYAPGAILGVYSADELEQREERNITSASEVVERATSKPKSRTEQMRQRLTSQTASAETQAVNAIGLDDVIAAIADAETMAALDAAAEMASTLTSDSDKSSARTAFAEKKKSLKAQAQTNAQEVWTYAQVMDAMVKAKSKDALDAATTLIEMVESDEHREELSRAYTNLASALENV